MAEVKCMNPWMPQNIRQYSADGIWPALPANSRGGQNRSGVCYEVGETVCLNFQGSKSNNATAQDGTAFGLCAMHGHDVHCVCYEVDQGG